MTNRNPYAITFTAMLGGSYNSGHAANGLLKAIDEGKVPSYMALWDDVNPWGPEKIARDDFAPKTEAEAQKRFWFVAGLNATRAIADYKATGISAEQEATAFEDSYYVIETATLALNDIGAAHLARRIDRALMRTHTDENYRQFVHRQAKRFNNRWRMKR